MRPNPFKSKEMRRQPKCLPALLAAVLPLAACVRRTRYPSWSIPAIPTSPGCSTSSMLRRAWGRQIIPKGFPATRLTQRATSTSPYWARSTSEACAARRRPPTSRKLLLSSEMTRDAVVTVEFMTQENGPCCRTPTSPPCGACRSAPTDAPWRAKPNGCSATAPTRSPAPTCTGNQKNFAISSSLRCCGWLGSPAR